jgi:hypothetical protein
LPLDEIERKAELDADAATLVRKGAYDQAYYQALLDLGKGSVDRSRSAAELVQKSAAAVGTLYVGILGVSFSVSNHRLPLRGLVPAVFLGAAIILSTAYAAFIPKRPGEVELGPVSTSPAERLQDRLDNFYTLITATVERHATWLRGAVAALAVGVALLPAPFISLTGGDSVDPSAGWPSPPAASSDREATLQAIVYKAQVDEAAARRQPVESLPDTLLWLAIGVVGAVAVRWVAVKDFGEEDAPSS